MLFLMLFTTSFFFVPIASKSKDMPANPKIWRAVESLPKFDDFVNNVKKLKKLSSKHPQGGRNYQWKK